MSDNISNIDTAINSVKITEWQELLNVAKKRNSSSGMMVDDLIGNYVPTQQYTMLFLTEIHFREGNFEVDVAMKKLLKTKRSLYLLQEELTLFLEWITNEVNLNERDAQRIKDRIMEKFDINERSLKEFAVVHGIDYDTVIVENI